MLPPRRRGFSEFTPLFSDFERNSIPLPLRSIGQPHLLHCSADL